MKFSKLERKTIITPSSMAMVPPPTAVVVVVHRKGTSVHLEAATEAATGGEGEGEGGYIKIIMINIGQTCKIEGRVRVVIMVAKNQPAENGVVVHCPVRGGKGARGLMLCSRKGTCEFLNGY